MHLDTIILKKGKKHKRDIIILKKADKQGRGMNKNHFQDCEGGDRLEYGLPFGQDELIEALLGVNKNLVLVLLSGNAVEMPWVSRVPAIVQGWYLGSMGGKLNYLGMESSPAKSTAGDALRDRDEELFRLFYFALIAHFSPLLSVSRKKRAGSRVSVSRSSMPLIRVR